MAQLQRKIAKLATIMVASCASLFIRFKVQKSDCSLEGR
jgi:hypothetical protein